ncbi:MAG: cell division protein ZapE [Gammaproteobacteria bacterium]
MTQTAPSTAPGSDLKEIYRQQLQERGFRSDPAQDAAVEALNDLRQRLLRNKRNTASGARRLLSKLGKPKTVKPEKGLYLWGGVGRGKTWLMDLFFQSLPFDAKRRRHFHRFMYDVHTQLKQLANQESPLELMADSLAEETRVLCFDEFFVSDIADAMILGTLLEALFRRGVTLVATSNVAPRDLYKDGLQRERFLPAIKLLEENTRVMAVDGGTDYRLRQLTQVGTYIDASDAQSDARLESLFAELADSSTCTGGTVEIEGRAIPVVKESENVIWFEFEALCEGPRSQNDYIEIAREYQSVIVSHVPKLTATRENAARRFIALIDELYDRHVNLIVSAAAPPTDLYNGERLNFEFQRTVSRLTEMQSEEYLASEHRP